MSKEYNNWYARYGMTPKVIEALQRLFDTALAHIRKQGRQSVNQDGTCAYRGDGDYTGCSCAAAPFINDYTAQMERKGWGTLVKHFEPRLAAEAVEYGAFVSKLQEAHDSSAFDAINDIAEASAFMRDYENCMELIARANGLTYTAP